MAFLKLDSYCMLWWKIIPLETRASSFKKTKFERMESINSKLVVEAKYE